MNKKKKIILIILVAVILVAISVLVIAIKPSSTIYTELSKISELNDGALPDITVSEKDNTPIFIDGTYSDKIVSDFDSAIDSLNDIKNLMGIENPKKEFKEKSLSVSEEYGTKHYKLQQYYNGIPVYGSELIVHTDLNGNTTCLTGGYIKISVSTTPKISETDAINSVKKEKNKNEIKSDGLYIYHSNSNKQYLVYSINVGENFGDDFIATETIFVSALDGKVVGSFSNIRSETYKGKGFDLSGIEREFVVEKENNLFYMTDLSKGISIWTYNHTKDQSEQITSINNSWNNADAVSLMNNLSYTVSFYKSKVKNAFDNNKLSKIYGCIQYKKNWNDASSVTVNDGRVTVLRFGDAKPRVNCLDTVAHEFTHSIISATCNLEYLNQSGAVNEAYADILGNLIENDNDEIWLQGEEHTAGGIRNLTNPHQFKQPEKVDDKYMHSYCNKDHEHGDSCDYGGVHTNSGIVNHAAYLMWRNGIDKSKLINLFCISLDYMKNTTDFLGCRAAILRSARDLKLTNKEITIIANAFSEVGIKPNVISSHIGNFSGKVVDAETKEGITDVKVVAKQIISGVSSMRDLSSYTNPLGEFALILPKGIYELTASIDGYKDYVIKDVKIDKDWEKTKLENEILLEKKTGTLKATVKDKTNGKPISNVKVEVNYGNTTVATVKTDEKGVFSVKLPYGSYSLYFTHDNYKLDNDTNREDVIVEHENNSLAEAILLTPITKIIDLSKYIGTDIVEFASLFKLEKVESDMPIEYGNKYVSAIGSKSNKIISICINSTMFDNRYDECYYSIYGIQCGMTIKNAEKILNREISTAIPASEEYSYYYFEVDGGVSLSLYASDKIHIVTLTDDIESELDVPQENQIRDLNFQINKENVKSFLTGVLSLITEHNVKLGSVSVSHDVDLYEFMRAEIEIQTTGLEEDTFYIDFYPKRKSGSNKLYYIEISSGYCDDKNDSDYVGYKVIVDALEEYLSGEALYGKKEQEIESLSNGKKGVSYYLEDNKYECSIVQINTSMGKTLYYYYIYANETSNNSTVSNQQKDYNIESYEELVDLCFEAINNDDISIIEPYIYDDYGNEWNKNHIYDIIGEFHGRYRDEEYYDEDEIKPKDCLPLAPNIESVNKQSKSEFEEAINWKLDNWFYNSDDYQKRVCEIQLEVVEERLIIDLDTEYPQGIILDKIDGRWYIDSIDLD